MSRLRKYALKPEIVEAVQHDGAADLAMVAWCNGKLVPSKDHSAWAIELPYNRGYIEPGDWLIKDSNDIFLVLANEQFVANGITVVGE